MRYLPVVETFTRRDFALRILNLGVDTAPPTGKLILAALGGITEFERAIMLERQRKGIAKAKAEGKYKGRSPPARANAAQVHALRQEGKAPSEIARRLGIDHGSVYRIITDASK